VVRRAGLARIRKGLVHALDKLVSTLDGLHLAALDFDEISHDLECGDVLLKAEDNLRGLTSPRQARADRAIELDVRERFSGGFGLAATARRQRHGMDVARSHHVPREIVHVSVTHEVDASPRLRARK
jgi:hypothetical protein